MLNWLHRLLHPHCEHCDRHDYEIRELELAKLREEVRCETCEVLKIENERLRQENNRLLNRLIEPKEQTYPAAESFSNQRIPTITHVPFSQKRRELEAASRAENARQTQALRERQEKEIAERESTEQLEDFMDRAAQFHDNSRG